MDRRLILAVALSFLVLMGWSRIVSKVYHIENKEVTIEKNTPSPPAEIKPPSLQTAVLPDAPVVKFENSLSEVFFLEQAAAIKEVKFKQYPAEALVLRQGLQLAQCPLEFKLVSRTDNEMTFACKNQNKEITKRFIFSNSNYGIELQLWINNISPATIKLEPNIILGSLDLGYQNKLARQQDILFAFPDKLLRPHPRKAILVPGVKFISLRSGYFCAIAEPQENTYAAFVQSENPLSAVIGMRASEFAIMSNQQIGQFYRIYIGPQDLKQINLVQPKWNSVIHYGTFDLISQGLLQVLGMFYRLTHNWGLAIIMLSLAVYFLLFPLTLKQMRSMKEMQILQPQIEALRKTHKDNPQKLNKEIMQLYKEHKVNPLGGCLPLILQMPIFFALYQGIARFISLKGAGFLWIKDLAEPDKLVILPFSLPIIGNELNILPLLMAGVMFLQQKTSMSLAGGSAAEQQKLMTILFPLMFGFIFYHMSAALVLYWFVNSLLMFVYQLKINRAK
jgi:YidC/Oxa1 family membrane protein insertase